MFDYEDMSLDDLYELKRKMENKMDIYVGEDKVSFHTGDEGYQEMLNDLYDVEEEIERKESQEEIERKESQEEIERKESQKNNEHKMNNLMNFDQFSLNEKKKPSAGLTKKEKSALVKKSKKGEDIGKPGKHFKEVAAKAAEHYGSKERGEKAAAAAMWKNIRRG
jgi:hypothetical protein